MTSMIAIEGVEKQFCKRGKQPVLALAEVNLEVPAGQFTTMVGLSGSGKSTLLRLVGGLTPPTAGTISIRGSRVVGPRPDAAFVFQSPLLLEWMTVLNNVLLPAKIKRGESKGEMRDRAMGLLETMGIADFAGRLPSELSGGMQQRVAIARALLLNPDLLLMDEPFGALDAITREQLNLELLRIWSTTSVDAEGAHVRKNVLMVTHDIAEAVFLSDVIVVMSPRPGRVVDLVEVTLARPRTLDMIYTEEFGQLAARVRAGLGFVEGVAPDPAVAPTESLR
jgi:NitT/TauT family transport system ATP-binding protein